MLGQPSITSTTAILSQMDHAVGPDQMMPEVIGKQVSAVGRDPFVFEWQRLLVESDHLHRCVRVRDKTTNCSLPDGTRRPGHHNREHCHTMPL